MTHASASYISTWLIPLPTSLSLPPPGVNNFYRSLLEGRTTNFLSFDARFRRPFYTGVSYWSSFLIVSSMDEYILSFKRLNESVLIFCISSKWNCRNKSEYNCEKFTIIRVNTKISKKIFIIFLLNLKSRVVEEWNRIVEKLITYRI